MWMMFIFIHLINASQLTMHPTMKTTAEREITLTILFAPQITAMGALNSSLYIGTSWGCLIIVECGTLTPVTVFRPFEEEVRYFNIVVATHQIYFTICTFHNTQFQ